MLGPGSPPPTPAGQGDTHEPHPRNADLDRPRPGRRCRALPAQGRPEGGDRGRLRHRLRLLPEGLLGTHPCGQAGGEGLAQPVAVLELAGIDEIDDVALQLVVPQHAAPLEEPDQAQHQGAGLERLQAAGLGGGRGPGMDDHRLWRGLGGIGRQLHQVIVPGEEAEGVRGGLSGGVEEGIAAVVPGGGGDMGGLHFHAGRLDIELDGERLVRHRTEVDGLGLGGDQLLVLLGDGQLQG